jgi:hypothetical protein
MPDWHEIVQNKPENNMFPPKDVFGYICSTPESDRAVKEPHLALRSEKQRKTNRMTRTSVLTQFRRQSIPFFCMLYLDACPNASPRNRQSWNDQVTVRFMQSALSDNPPERAEVAHNLMKRDNIPVRGDAYTTITASVVLSCSE